MRTYAVRSTQNSVHSTLVFSIAKITVVSMIITVASLLHHCCDVGRALFHPAMRAVLWAAQTAA